MKEITKFIKEGLKITSKTKVNERPEYNYHPKTKEELKSIIRELIKNVVMKVILMTLIHQK